MADRKRPREWQVDDRDEYGDFNRQAAVESLLECESIGHRLGGAFMVAPVRREVAPGSYITDGWIFRWESFMPGIKQQDPEPEQNGQADVEHETVVEG